MIYGHASYKIGVGISSIPRAVLPTPRINLWMSLGIISGNGMLRAITAREEPSISPASAIFISSSLIRRARFSSMLLASKLTGYYRSIRGGLL